MTEPALKDPRSPKPNGPSGQRKLRLGLLNIVGDPRVSMSLIVTDLIELARLGGHTRRVVFVQGMRYARRRANRAEYGRSHTLLGIAQQEARNLEPSCRIRPTSVWEKDQSRDFSNDHTIGKINCHLRYATGCWCRFLTGEFELLCRNDIIG